MSTEFRFTYDGDWRLAPMAYWVHRPVDGAADLFEPPAPLIVPHRGFAVLRVEFGKHELVFSSPAQLLHCIEVLSLNPLPTTRALSTERGYPIGPNGHWLSRLPAGLKSPRTRFKLVAALQAISDQVINDGNVFKLCAGGPK